MAPMILNTTGVEGGAGVEGSGSGLKRLGNLPTPPAIHATEPPSTETASEAEEGEDMATTAERLSAVEEKQDGLLDLAHKLELGQERAEGARALAVQRMDALAAEVAKIPGIEAKATECAANTAQILAILQGAGLVAQGSGGAQLAHWLMPALRQLPPQVILLIAAYLLFTGKITL